MGPAGLASIPDAMPVITDDGQVSLVNYAAKALLGAERVAVGNSVYAALSRTTVQSAMARAGQAGRPVDAMIGTLEEHQLTAKVASLPAHGGAVITIPAEEVEFRTELDADLALHDLPPPPEAFGEDTPLERLPILVLDTETTGLDAAHDRIVSIGALRLVGGRMYRATSFGGASLDAGAGELGVSIHGRHTALGDSLVTAEIFASLLPRLADQGVATLGQATAFSRRAKGVIRAQTEAGW